MFIDFNIYFCILSLFDIAIFVNIALINRENTCRVLYILND